MNYLYNDAHIAFRKKVKTFVDTYIRPRATEMEGNSVTDPCLIEAMFKAGFLSTHIPEQYGGFPIDAISFGILNEEIGSISSSVRSLITVNSMVCYALDNWGDTTQKSTWLPKLASGKALGAFALSEPMVGSDANGLLCEALVDSDNLVVSGIKTWISYGQIATLFLVFVKYDKSTIALLVERDTPGFEIRKLNNLQVERAAMHAELRFDKCRIKKSCILGPAADGVPLIAMSCLGLGRLSVAWGGLGMSKACLKIASSYTRKRKQFNLLLRDHQLIKSKITEIIVNIEAAEALCVLAAQSYDKNTIDSFLRACIAKHFVAVSTVDIVNKTIPLLGARGLTDEYPLMRYLNECKVLEIIEGSNHIHEILISNIYIVK